MQANAQSNKKPTVSLTESGLHFVPTVKMNVETGVLSVSAPTFDR